MLISRSVALSVVAAALTTACITMRAAEPAATPGTEIGASDVDPSGTYTFVSQSQSFRGVFTIRRDAGGRFGGTVTTSATGDLPIRSVQRIPEGVRVTAVGKQGDAIMDFTLRDPSFVARWEYGGSRGFLTGTRTSGPAAAATPLPAKGDDGVEYAGKYFFGAANLDLRIFEDGGHLSAQATGQRPFPLLYTGGHHFVSPPGIGIQFQFNVAAGKATSLALLQHGKTYSAGRVR